MEGKEKARGNNTDIAIIITWRLFPLPQGRGNAPVFVTVGLVHG